MIGSTEEPKEKSSVTFWSVPDPLKLGLGLQTLFRSLFQPKISALGSFFVLAAVHKHSQSLTHRVGPSHHKTLSRLDVGACERVRECERVRVCVCLSHLLLPLSPSHSRLNFKVKEVAHAWAR